MSLLLLEIFDLIRVLFLDSLLDRFLKILHIFVSLPGEGLLFNVMEKFVLDKTLFELLQSLLVLTFNSDSLPLDFRLKLNQIGLVFFGFDSEYIHVLLLEILQLLLVLYLSLTNLTLALFFVRFNQTLMLLGFIFDSFLRNELLILNFLLFFFKFNLIVTHFFGSSFIVILLIYSESLLGLLYY